jgi:hypothetical protein
MLVHSLLLKKKMSYAYQIRHNQVGRHLLPLPTLSSCVEIDIVLSLTLAREWVHLPISATKSSFLKLK